MTTLMAAGPEFIRVVRSSCLVSGMRRPDELTSGTRHERFDFTLGRVIGTPV